MDPMRQLIISRILQYADNTEALRNMLSQMSDTQLLNYYGDYARYF